MLMITMFTYPSPVEGYWILNEVLTNFQSHGFVELFTPHGVSSDSPFNYGVTILAVDSRKVFIRAVFDIPKMDLPAGSYFVLGDPQKSWTSQDVVQHGMSGSSDDAKVYGESGILDVSIVKPKNPIVSVVLTESTIPVPFLWPVLTGRAKKAYLDEYVPFKEMLYEEQTDAVVFKHHSIATGSCSIITKVIPRMKKKIPFLLATLGSAWPKPISWNRCGPALNRFDHEEYKGGDITPYRSNDCTKENFNPDIANFIGLAPTSTTFENPCRRDEDEDYYHAGDDMINATKIATAMLSAMSNENPTDACPTSDQSRSNTADELMEAHIENMEVESNEETDEAMEVQESMEEIEERGKKAIMTENIRLINLHQAHLFYTPHLQKHWPWFHYNFNPDDQSGSTFYCDLCHQHLPGTRFHNQLVNSRGILKLTQDQNMRAISDHTKSEGHRKAVQLEALKKAKLWKTPVPKAIQDQIKEDNGINVNHVRLGFFTAKNHNSFQEYSRTAHFLRIMGVNMGKFKCSVRNFFARSIQHSVRFHLE